MNNIKDTYCLYNHKKVLSNLINQRGIDKLKAIKQTKINTFVLL
jgi:hypothetical protein